MTESQKLLAEYVQSGSEAAFGEIVKRYLDLTYSTAMRLVGGNAHLAQDVTQHVFIDLARAARTLSREAMLGGWLHRHTCFLARNLMRSERRRTARERQALEMNALHDGSSMSPSEIAPVLDAAINQLSTQDRAAILLRFFEQRDFRSVGEMLGISENAARMRVSRALEKLGELLKRQGIACSAAALGTALAADVVVAAPAGMAAAVASTAFAAATTGTATTLSLLKIMSMTKLQLGAATLIVAGMVTGLVTQRQLLLKLQKQDNAWQKQVSQLQTANVAISNELSLRRANQPRSANTERLRELLKLRGEVGLLRRQQREFEQTISDLRLKTAAQPGHSTPEAGGQQRVPAPFQMQLVLDEPGQDTQSVTNNAGETLLVRKTPLLDHTAIRSATLTRNPVSGAPEIGVEFSPEGTELFAAITRENINKRFAIVMNGQMYSAPMIRSEISGGRAQITGAFTEDEASELTAKINAMAAQE